MPLTLEETVALTNLVGSLPTAQGAYPLFQKLKSQVEGQIEAQKNPPIVAPPLPWSV
jgi:hypothetical protein